MSIREPLSIKNTPHWRTEEIFIMKKPLKVCITAVCLVAVAVFAFKPLSFLLCDVFSRPENGYTCRTERPLQSVDVTDSAEYLPVKHWNDEIEVVTDTQKIKQNVRRFRIANSGNLYGTTADGYFELYKNGERIGFAIFDHFGFTWAIDYGSLKFTPITRQELEPLIEKE
jgi:hypothetical protein